MKFLVIKHVIPEGLGIFEQFCYEAGILVDTVELEKGERFPSLEEYDALWVMGGPMNVADEADYSWLADEKALLRKAVGELHLPYLGICLGAKLLADALGGEVQSLITPEVGILPVHLTEVGLHHPLTTGLSKTFNVLQWHGQAVSRLLVGSLLLASSAECQVQAYSIGEHAFGLQFHSEVTQATVEDWIQIPAYRLDLEATLGITGCDDFKQAVVEHLSTLKKQAKILFDNFLRIVQINY